ncbi:hypothetical protein EAO70_34390 [Streptomyces sp. adm13(2018)]|uniref:hypothetical protein n=1 Tax=Streptomyces sp. adm13(2018) TaxID=2479007 RepID=UPI0011CE5100|nr:hypothetical protein [Streptomyces sp. adm13(2018)]TXS09842.1 hypothetical protein EAO70_34390 [Streptomyces sp. adm13(2018)]
MSARIDRDTYTVLRDRLAAHATELAGRAGKLNEARTAVFGSGEPGTARSVGPTGPTASARPTASTGPAVTAY